jgi:hypothetical protein
MLACVTIAMLICGSAGEKFREKRGIVALVPSSCSFGGFVLLGCLILWKLSCRRLSGCEMGFHRWVGIEKGEGGFRGSFSFLFSR